MPTFTTPEPIRVVVEMGTGHLEISATDRTDTVVEVRPADPDHDADVQAAEQTEVSLTDGHLRVTAPRKRLRSLFGRPPSVDVTIDLPSGSSLDASTAADVRVGGRLGDTEVETAIGAVRLAETGRVTVRTAAGDVFVGRSTGRADVTTSSGRIRVDGIEGSAALKTSNGDLSVGEVTGDARLSTANGDITVDRALASVAAKTAHGSVRIGEVVRGAVAVDTGFGEIEVGVRDGTAAWLDVQSGLGSVRSLLDAGDAPGAGEQTVEVRGRTGYGDIVIRRAASAA